MDCGETTVSMASPSPELVEPFDFPATGRGQRALRDIAKGEVVLSVSLDDCWTPAAARAALGLVAAPVLPALERLPEPRVLKTPLLALHLLAERARGAASPRFAHIQTLPAEFDTPLHWTDDELGALRACASDWHAFAVRARAEAALDYDELVATLGAAVLDALGADRTSYLWACTAFQSRLMDVQGAGALMAPRLDLFNHTADPQARGSFGLEPEGGRHVRVTAYRDFAAGEQVFISYGAHPNSRLLFSYGFVLGSGAANPFEAVELADSLPFGPACTDEAARLRSALALRAAMPFAAAPDEAHAAGAASAPPPLSLDIPSLAELSSDAERAAMRLVLRHALSLAAPLPTPLLVSARLAQLDDAELRVLEASPALFDAVAHGSALSAQNENAALLAVGAKLAALRQRYAGAQPTGAGGAGAAVESECGARRAALAQALADGERAIIAAAEAALRARMEAAAATPIRRLLPQPNRAQAAVAAATGASDDAQAGTGASEAVLAPAPPVHPLPIGSAVRWADGAAGAAACWEGLGAAAADGATQQRAATVGVAQRVLVCARDVGAGELLWTVPLEQCYGTEGAASDERVVAALGAGLGAEAGVAARCLPPLLIAIEQQQQQSTRAAGAEQDGAHGRVSAAAALRLRVTASPPLRLWGQQQEEQQQPRAGDDGGGGGVQAQGHAEEAPAVALAGSRWLAELADSQDELRADWSALQGALAQTAAGRALLASGGIVEEEYSRALAVWHAGAADGRADGGWPVTLLVPALADGCVHDPSLPDGCSLSLERSAAGGGLLACVRALAPMRAGEVVRARLGYEPSGELLLRRGFVAVPNAHDRVELSLTLRCTARTLEPAMLAAPEAPSDLLLPSAFEFVRVPTDVQLEEAGEEGAPLVTRHSVSAGAPLPPALLALLRLERLTPAELASVEAATSRRGVPLWRALQNGDALSPSNELHALHAAEAIALAQLGAYGARARQPRGLARPQPQQGGAAPEAAAAPSLVWCTSAQQRAAAAAAVIESEASALRALAAVAQAKRRELVESFVARMHRLPGKRADEASPWVSLLRACRPRLDRLSAEVGGTCARLLSALELAASLSDEAAEEAHLLLARFCASAFGWLMNCAPEPQGRPAALPAAGCAYAEEYRGKVRLWGCFLLAQWTEATTLGMAELNAMLMESVDIRSRHSWSVPSDAALSELCALGPLSLAGDRNGTWLAQLRQRGADVEPLEPGAKPSGGRTLVLCWPDAKGEGPAGLDAVRGYDGRVLATLGEWRGHTYGAFADGLREHGQSFSAECQLHVGDAFELRSVTPLPNWPLARDALLVWDRRA